MPLNDADREQFAHMRRCIAAAKAGDKESETLVRAVLMEAASVGPIDEVSATVEKLIQIQEAK